MGWLKKKETDDYNFRLRVQEKLVWGNEKHFYQGQGIGECLQRLGAHLPNEKTDLITPPLPQLPEPSPPLSNQSVLQLQLPAGGGVGGTTRLYNCYFGFARKKISVTGHYQAPTVLTAGRLSSGRKKTRQTCNFKIQKIFLKSIYH